MSYQAIKDLVGYALRTGLIEEYDRPWAVNELLKAMGMDAWEEPAETHERPLEDILKELNPAYADSKAQNQRIDKIEAAISGVADSVRQIQQFLQSSTIKTRKE